MNFQHHTLTPGRVSSMMRPVVATAATGIRTPSNTGVKAPFYGVFLYPSFWHGVSLAVFVMAGCSGQPQGWPVPVSGSSNPLHPVAQSFEPLFDGLSLAIQDKSL